MTNPPPTPTRSLQILKTILYVLAVLVLVLGGFAGASLITSASNMMANFLMPLQIMGAGDIANLFTPIFTGVFINLGIVTLILPPSSAPCSTPQGACSGASPISKRVWPASNLLCRSDFQSDSAAQKTTLSKTEFFKNLVFEFRSLFELKNSVSLHESMPQFEP